MSKVLHIHPENKHDTKVSWEEDEITYKVDLGFEFSDGFVFTNMKKVVAFHFAESFRDNFVGRVFDYYGDLLFDIPFPNLEAGQSNIECFYNWSSEIENGVKIVFGTNTVSFRDFWCDFDLEMQKYVATNEAR